MLVDFNEGAGEVVRASAATCRPSGSCRSTRSSRGISSSSARRTRWSATTSRIGADGAALPADDDRSRATTSSPRTATSSPATASSGRSCRSRSTDRSGAPTGRRFRCCSPRRCCRCRCSCASTSDYRYRLAGTERVGELDCYVVRFEPVRRGQLALPRHRLDRSPDVRARQGAGGADAACPRRSSRTRRSRPIAPVASIGNRPVFLFTGLTARQIVLIAGRNLLVEKTRRVQRLPRQRRRASSDARPTARASDRVMYRETDRGLRYYVKEGDDARRQRPRRRAARGRWRWASRSIRRTPFRCRSSASTISNFEFGGPDTQLAILFAGVLAAGNIQRPKLGAHAVRRQRRLLRDRGAVERSALRRGRRARAGAVLTWPLSTGLNLGWQSTPFQKVTAQYQFRFDGYVRDTTTSETFVVPASTVTNGFGGAWEYRRGGYSVVANGAWFARAGWREWGVAGAEPPIVTPTLREVQREPVARFLPQRRSTRCT